jgi:hypothetical protein
MPSILLSMDVEASGPCPGMGDMISFAAVVIEPGLARQWHSENMLPECEKYNPQAYSSIGMSREQHLAAKYTLRQRVGDFVAWLHAMEGPDSRYIMVSDNPGFDFSWVNYYLHHYGHGGVLGHSARRIGDVWAGLRGRSRETKGWKRLRIAPHDHNPLNDALGNAQAWQEMWRLYGPQSPSALKAAGVAPA